MMNKWHFSWAAAAVALAMTVLPTAASGASWPNTAEVAVHTGPVAYPRSAVDALGARIVLDAPPRRIVSLEYEIDEYLYRIAAPQDIVGVSTYAYTARTSNVLGPVNRFQPKVAGDIETILRLKPDLVVAAVRSRSELVHALQSAGVRVFRLPTMAARLEQVAENVSVVGYLTGRDETARQERQRFERELAGIAERCKKSGHPPARVFGVSMIGYTQGDQTLFQDIVRLVGAVNVAAQHGIHAYEKVGNETVLRWNPDWVFTWSDPGKGAEELRRWRDDPALGATAAVRKGQVVVSDGKDHLSLSQEATRLAQTMANTLCRAD
jgi:iron complex transport system substrate-binding protein